MQEKEKQITTALFTATEADAQLACALKQLNTLRTHLPDALNSPFVDVLDQLNAARCRVQTLRHDLLIILRGGK